MIKRFVERRARNAAQVTVMPVNMVQYCSPCSPSSEMSFDTRVDNERNEEGRMNPERDQLEPPSAVSPERGELTNYRRRLLTRGREVKFGGIYFSHHGTR